MATASLTPSEQLQARLSDPRTVDALNRLLDRLDVLAFSAEMMDSFFRRSSEVADSVADSVAEVRQLGGGAGSVEFIEKLPVMANAGMKLAETASSPSFERLLNSGLLEQLSQPKTIETLKSLLDRLEVAAFSLQALDDFVRRADVIANSIADSVSEIRESSPGSAANFIERLPQLASTGAQLADVAQKPEFTNLLSLVDKAGKQETIEKLGLLLEKLDLAVFALNAFDGFLRRSPEMTEAVAEGAADLRQLAPGLDAENLQETVRDMMKLLEAGRKLVASGLLDKLDELANTGLMLSKAGMFEPSVVSTLGEVGRMASESFTEARKTPPKRVGLFGLLRALNDPDTERALGVLLESGRRFGAKLK